MDTPAPPIRLAHFSDVHLTTRPLGWALRDLRSKRVSGWFNLRALGRGKHFRYAEQVVKDQLAKLKAQGASVQALKEPALGKTFADYEFVSVRFPQFPVARLAPEPLRSSNVSPN